MPSRPSASVHPVEDLVASGSSRRLSSLKFHLAALLVPFVTLVVIAAAYQGSATLDQAEERRQLGVDFRADLAADEIENAIAQAEESIAEVAGSPGVASVLEATDASGCSLVFQAPAPFSSGHLDVLDTGGAVVCSSLEDPTTTGYVEAPWLGAGLLDSAIAGPVEDVATGERVLILTAPIDGRGQVAAFLDVDAVTAGLSERLSGPVSTEFALIDSTAGEETAAPPSGDWLAATAAVPSLGWEVQAWTDRSAATAQVKALNTHVLAYLLGCVLLLLGAVLVVYRGIARPIEKLSASVRGVVAGALDVVPAAVSGPAEVVALASGFAELVENVQAERAQREQAELAQAEAQAEREADAAMLRSIVQSTQSLIYVKDLDGAYLMANAAFTRATGLAEEDVVGQTDMIISPANAARWAADDVRARSGVYELEEWLGDAGERHCFESIKFPLYNARGALYAVGGVSLDVTERRRHTAALARARDAALAANAAKSTFLATMSHEIRTPMTAVIGMTDLLEHTDLSAHQRELVDTIQSSGDALLAVINNILDISKIESGELQLELAVVELPTTVERSLDVVALAAAEKGIELVCFVDDSCPARVTGDVVRLRQILTNLLANAVKFTERGQVVVDVSAGSPSDDGVIPIRIAVTDSGIGISKESLARLFKSFSQVDASTTRTYGGTGLGLVIARRLAEAMGGGVTVTSVPGAGSSFVVTLALHSCPEAGPIEVVGEPTADVLSGRAVLVVDDNLANLRALELQVTRLGLVCTTADSGAAAAALVADGLTYDVALLDLRMPDVDGLALGRALRASTTGSAASPQVILTEVGRAPQGIESEFAQVVTKPAKTIALREALAAAVIEQPHDDQFSRTATPATRASRRLRILVAEDHRVNQRVIELMLRELGHEVDIVADGRRAVDALAGGQYDVVLMDLQMPRMDGLEATRRIRAGHNGRPQPHIIAMTASTLVDDRVACAAAGMDSYLSKPVRAADLQAMLEQATENGADAASGWFEPSLDASSTAASPRGPAVDIGVLDALLSSYASADGALRAELITDYLEDGTALVHELLAATDAGDHRRFAAAAHALRSPSALLGAMSLAALLTAAERSDPVVLPASAWRTDDIAREYARVASALRPLIIPEDMGGDRAPVTRG